MNRCMVCRAKKPDVHERIPGALLCRACRTGPMEAAMKMQKAATAPEIKLGSEGIEIAASALAGHPAA